jgi:hypothetical protein
VQTKSKAAKQAKRSHWGKGRKEAKGGKCARGWVSTSLLSSAVAEEVTSESFENASSEAFATEQVFDLVGQRVFASFWYFAAFLIETCW